MKEADRSTVSLSVFSEDPGSPSLWHPVTMRSSSLTSDMVLLKDSLIIALGLGAVVSVMCKLGLSGLRFPGFHSLCFQVGGPLGLPSA